MRKKRRRKRRPFKESKLAHQYLDGLEGVEIGASAHNPFGLNTINVDKFPCSEQNFAQQVRLCGRVADIDYVADATELPFEDKSYDFVISSHVLEHIFDPIKAIREWERVARKYIYIIVPHKMRCFDRARPTTSVAEFKRRHEGRVPYDYTDMHHCVWVPSTFVEMCAAFDITLAQLQDPDDKVGNGFAAIISL